MQQQDEFVTIMKDMMLLFSVLASVGSFYHGKVIAGLCYLAVAAVLHHEAAVRHWLRRHFSSGV
jgi:hypothetical protein